MAEWKFVSFKVPQFLYDFIQKDAFKNGKSAEEKIVYILNQWATKRIADAERKVIGISQRSQNE